MKRFQLETLLIDIRTTLLQIERIIQLCVECQHVQLHHLAIDFLHRIDHILNKLRIRGTCRMHPDHHFRLLRLLLVSTFGAHLLTIGVNGILAHLISIYDRSSQQLIQSRRKAFTWCRITNDQRRVIQASQFFWSMIETIGTPCHQGHQQATSHEQGSHKLVALQTLADVFQYRIILKHRFNLLAPVPKPLIHVVVLQYRQLFIFHFPILT